MKVIIKLIEPCSSMLFVLGTCQRHSASGFVHISGITTFRRSCFLENPCTEPTEADWMYSQKVQVVLVCGG